MHTEEGTPQGGPVSPILANVYLHYVLDLWFERRFKKTCRKWAELTRYCDDFVAAFQDQADAERFRREVEERLAAFGLKVAPEKTAIRHFDGNLLKGPGRPAERPETFTFLGFTHFIAKTRAKKLNIIRTPSVHARARFLRRVAEWLQVHRHVGPGLQREHLTKMLSGFYQYFGLWGCTQKLAGVRFRMYWLWRQTLRRRSDMGRRTSDWMTLFTKSWFRLPQPRLTQPWV